MIDFLNKIIKINQLLVAGIYRVNEKEFYYSLYVRRNKNNLDIISIKEYSSQENLFKDIDIKIPIILVVDGKGVLNKKINPDNESDTLWKRNIDFNTIYFSNVDSKQFSFFSFCRKENADTIINRFVEKKIHVIDCYIGPLAAAIIQPAIQKDNIISNGDLLEFSDNELINIKKSQFSDDTKKYIFNNTWLSAPYLPLYGAAIDFYLKHKQINKNKPEVSTEDYIYQKSFNLFSTVILILFFGSLLISYLSIQYYSHENIKLNQENIFSNQTYQRIIKLENQRDEKLRILNETRQSSNNFLSFYVYEIAKSVPYEIKLLDVNVFPITKEIKAQHKISVDSNYIHIKGSTLSESSFNKWIEILKNLNWIKKFEIILLKKDRKNIQHFEIKVIPDDF